MKVSIKGEDQLKKKLAALSSGMRGKVLENAVRSGAQLIQNSAVQKAPVLTGNLRRSIHTEITKSSDTNAYAEIGTDVEYAPYVEFGTSRQSAQPYLRPALDENRDKARQEIVHALKAQIDRIV